MNGLTWYEDYCHDCDVCWRNYNSGQPPCFRHRGDPRNKVQTEQNEVAACFATGYTWGLDDSPHDFATERPLLNKLRFLKHIVESGRIGGKDDK